MVDYLLEKSSTEVKEHHAKIAIKQDERKAFNTNDVGELIYSVKIPLLNFSDCKKQKHYSSDICHHVRDNGGNILEHPINKMVVTNGDAQLHNAKGLIRLTFREILTILNSNREEDFRPYDTNDWLSGLVEWTYLRLPENHFYPMFFGAIELGHGIDQHAELRQAEKERKKNSWHREPNVVRELIRERRMCGCMRHRAKKSSYYG